MGKHGIGWSFFGIKLCVQNIFKQDSDSNFVDLSSRKKQWTKSCNLPEQR